MAEAEVHRGLMFRAEQNRGLVPKLQHSDSRTKWIPLIPFSASKSDPILPFQDWTLWEVLPKPWMSNSIWASRLIRKEKFQPIRKTLPTQALTPMNPGIRPCESGRPQTAGFSTWRITTAFDSGWNEKESPCGRFGPRRQLLKIPLRICWDRCSDFCCGYEA